MSLALVLRQKGEVMSVNSAMDRMSLELELSTLREAYSQATSIIEVLTEERDSLALLIPRKELRVARDLVMAQERTIARLMDQIATLKNENSFLKEDMAELETRLGGFVSEAV